jgi:hypothetical protein
VNNEHTRVYPDSGPSVELLDECSNDLRVEGGMDLGPSAQRVDVLL